MHWKKKWAIRQRRWMHQLKIAFTSLNYQTQLILNWLLPVFAISAAGIALYDIGFNAFYHIQQQLWVIFHWLSIALSFLLSIKFILMVFDHQKRGPILVYLVFTLAFLYMSFSSSLYVVKSTDPHQTLLISKVLQYGIALLLAVSEISKLAGILYNKGARSSVIFAGSFLFFIGAGAGLLMLPNSTITGIELADAFFMSTSAVCVTGLATIPLSDFTFLGQIIMLGLLQIGGLGVMTFAGLLGHSLAGRSSFQSQLALKDMVSSNHLSNVLQTVNTIIGVSLIFELLGILLLYSTTDSQAFETNGARIYFAIFHSISAFCNAGFSTLPDGLASVSVASNFSMQWVIMILIILGGMGFPILFNVYSFLVHKIKSIGGFLLLQRPKRYAPRLLNLTSRLAMQTSLILIVIGFALYLLLESNHSLRDSHSIFERITTAMFGSVTSRTAGFNTIDFATLQLPTLLVIILLMWIGASPASTGGGIKTTTMAVALLNMVSIIRGKNRTEFNRREISINAIRRSFAVILLSLGIIGLCTLGVSIHDSDKGLLRIVFESFSAFSTVGLSLGITSDLSDLSKIILSITMFFGRVGTLTLMAAMISQSAPLKYRYPTEDILI
jgi:trk system potassium uptake protein